MKETDSGDRQEPLSVAVIGIAGRFPGARNIDEFWRNLRNGVESIRLFTDDEMKALGVDNASLRSPNFVKAGAILDDIDKFDAGFFGYSPREAELIDPQHRIFLECAVHALEDAGYDPRRYEGSIGVFAGVSMSTYLLFNLMASSHFGKSEDSFQLMIGNDKDFISTRVSYELNLRGPSIDVQTGCSTSLVAIHLACQSLLSYECDMALAGGASVSVPQRTGYYYEEGGISSPDGHCRAFDAAAQGTIFGSGAALVVLKRLEDAVADGDSIHAVVLGSAVNNDGSVKLGYTAPGVNGQAEVIARAQAMAGVDPGMINYLEAHGTATELGDLTEVRALSKAFGESAGRGFCALGSVKTNIGHLDAAAGVAGFIKTVLALKHRQIPPSLHFSKPNPRLDLENSPFYVNAELAEWKTDRLPRRAGVSSFGIGGTNAHAILEEAAPQTPGTPATRTAQLLILSARTGTSLETACTNLATHMQTTDQELPDTAYTLAIGRTAFPHRRIAICRDREDAFNVLSIRDPERVWTASISCETPPPVVFMFPGGGAQHINMGRQLYEQEEVFRSEIDRCAALLETDSNYNLRDIIYPPEEKFEEATKRMRRTAIALPALFAVEFALAQLWQSWGVKPQAMIGHSLGEYVAACIAGVLSLKEALKLVVLRGQLFERLPRGAMLSVGLDVNSTRALINGKLCIAAVNAPELCVVSGEIEKVEALASDLESREIDHRRIQIEVAAHSEMVSSIVGDFVRSVGSMQLNPPAKAYISNVTGTWITADEAADPEYWGRQLRHTVRFSEGLATLLEDTAPVLLEVGPGRTLSTLARLNVPASNEKNGVNNDDSHSRQPAVISSMRHANDPLPDIEVMLAALGKLWLAGTDIAWQDFYRREQRRRVSLPPYPFERQRYWIAPDAPHTALTRRLGWHKAPVEEWFYVPSWRRSPVRKTVKLTGEPGPMLSRQRWLIFEDEAGIGRELCRILRDSGQDVIQVRPAPGKEACAPGTYTIEPADHVAYAELVRTVADSGGLPDQIIHLWSISSEDEVQTANEFKERFETFQARGFYSLLYLAQALASHGLRSNLHLSVVSNNVLSVESDEQVRPEKNTMTAACKVLPQEYEQIKCRQIDVLLRKAGDAHAAVIAEQVLAEVEHASKELVVAYRGRHRWVQSFEPMVIEESAVAFRRLRDGGVYLITGGTGNVGWLIASHLASQVRAKLVLLSRGGLSRLTERQIELCKELEALGAEVLIEAADVSDETRMGEVVESIKQKYGKINGIIHAAGISGEKAVRLIPEVDMEYCREHFRAKVYGTHVLARVLKDEDLDFCLLVSSNTSVLGGLGSISYAAANLFLDAFALRQNEGTDISWISANWDGWLSGEEARQGKAPQTSIDRYAMTPAESAEALRRVLIFSPASQTIVSAGNLAERLDLWIHRRDLGAINDSSDSARTAAEPRSATGTAYVAPGSEVEHVIAGVWQSLLGISQVGINDNFFDLGGNSLIGLKVISQLKKALNVSLPMVALFEGPTVAALAKLINSDAQQEPVYEESRSRGERRRERNQRSPGRTPSGVQCL